MVTGSGYCGLSASRRFLGGPWLAVDSGWSWAGWPGVTVPGHPGGEFGDRGLPPALGAHHRATEISDGGRPHLVTALADLDDSGPGFGARGAGTIGISWAVHGGLPVGLEAGVVAGPALTAQQVVALAFLASALQVAGAADLGAKPNASGVAGRGGALQQIHVRLSFLGVVPVSVRFGRHDVPVLPPLGALLLQLTHHGKSHVGVGSPPTPDGCSPAAYPHVRSPHPG